MTASALFSRVSRCTSLLPCVWLGQPYNLTTYCSQAVEDVQPKEGFWEKPYVRAALAGRALSTLKLLESHGDQVRALVVCPSCAWM